MQQEKSIPTGDIILLNGASSSGKSSIARALQARLPRPFWHISIDHLRDAGVLPLDRIRQGEFPWAEMRDAFFLGFERSLVAYAEAGNHLVVEYIVETSEGMQRLVSTLGQFDVFFVGVHCPLQELERREKARGDRPVGDARRDFLTVHAHVEYDFEVDGTAPPEQNAELIVEAWAKRPQASTFSQRAHRA